MNASVPRGEPVRSCLGCGRRDAKTQLFRVVLEPDGSPRVDVARLLPGRGAYLCGAGCLKAALKRKAFGRAFRGKARLADETLTRMWAALGGEAGGWKGGVK